MNIISRAYLLAIKVTFILIAGHSAFAQAQEESLFQHQKNQKPLFLDIRFCSCKAFDIESESITPLPEFLDKAASIKVGISESDLGFVSAGGLRFDYSIAPDKETNSFVLEYSGEYIKGKKSSSSQSVIIVDLDNWVTIMGYENISDQGNDYFNVAIKLAHSTKNY